MSNTKYEHRRQTGNNPSKQTFVEVDEDEQHDAWVRSLRTPHLIDPVTCAMPKCGHEFARGTGVVVVGDECCDGLCAYRFRKIKLLY